MVRARLVASVVRTIVFYNHADMSRMRDQKINILEISNVYREKRSVLMEEMPASRRVLRHLMLEVVLRTQRKR